MGKPKPAPANNPKPPKKKPVVYHDYAQFQAALKINHLEHEAFDRYETAPLEVLKKAVKDKTPVGSFVAICAVIAGFYLGRGHHYSHQSRLAGSRAQRARAGVPSAMKVTAPLKAAVGIVILALAGCATDYQSQGFTGGYTDLMTAPDEAVVTFHGNGYTSVERVGAMAALRRAEITLQHGCRYFVLVNAANVSGSSCFTTPGVANTYGSAYGFGNFATGSATTIVTPPQTHTFFKPGIQMVIKMSNDERSLETIGLVINGQRGRPKDAAFLSQSLRQYLGVKGNT